MSSKDFLNTLPNFLTPSNTINSSTNIYQKPDDFQVSLPLDLPPSVQKQEDPSRFFHPLRTRLISATSTLNWHPTSFFKCAKKTGYTIWLHFLWLSYSVIGLFKVPVILQILPTSICFIYIYIYIHIKYIYIIYICSPAAIRLGRLIIQINYLGLPLISILKANALN